MHSQSDFASRPEFAAVRFMVDAEASPGLLPRLLQPFAKRDLTPDRMWSHRSGGTMHVELALTAAPIEYLNLIEANLRQIVGVHNVVQVRQAVLQVVA